VAKQILSTKPATMQATVKAAPLLPGCYIYRDSKKKILYIGKAKVLRNRVRSYFQNYERVEEKIRQMIDRANSVEFIVVDSEIEALILESNLIKKYKPKYNSLMVDDKHYIYVRFEPLRKKELTSSKQANDGKEDFPEVMIVREKKDDGSEYFGPYPDTLPAKRLLKRLRRVFPYRTCDRRIVQVSADPLKVESSNPVPCLYYHLGLCNAPCAGLESKAAYQRNYNNIRKFFLGQKNDIAYQVELEMKAAAKRQEFEVAARLRNRLADIKYIASNINLDKDIDEVAIMQAKKERKQRALEELVGRLKFPVEAMDVHPKEGFRIECYDISNIQGTNAVGAMVVFIDGEPRPDLYRRFRIQMKNEPNDFAMLQEVLTRRFNQYLRSQMAYQKDPANEVTEITDIEGFTIEIPKDLQKKIKAWKPDPSFSQMPDLIIIDGGKGQLSSTYKILSDFGLVDRIPMVGLAKREEDIFKVAEQFNEPLAWEGGQVLSDNVEKKKLTYTPIDDVSGFEKIHLPRRSEALYLMQRIRDEAHRFGITYHRKLRSKVALQ
jgi:excinuclease UvrABC nuclease subunit